MLLSVHPTTSQVTEQIPLVFRLQGGAATGSYLGRPAKLPVRYDSYPTNTLVNGQCHRRRKPRGHAGAASGTRHSRTPRLAAVRQTTGFNARTVTRSPLSSTAPPRCIYLVTPTSGTAAALGVTEPHGSSGLSRQTLFLWAAVVPTDAKP